MPCLSYLASCSGLCAHAISSAYDDSPPLSSSYDGSICSDSFFCGGISIMYPFYLSDATRETSDYQSRYSCGYTDLEISCQGEGPIETPIITLGGESYAVQDIIYDNHTIILADSDALVGTGCPAVRRNVSFDELWLHSTSTFHNLTFFYGCYPNGTAPLELDAYKIKCAEFKSPLDAGAGDSFVFTSDELESDNSRYQEELARNCRMIVTTPVRSDGLTAASIQSNFTGDVYGEVLRRGFALEWSRITADGCHLCEESDGQCAYGSYREFLACLCHGGKVGNPYCKPASRSKGKKGIIASKHYTAYSQYPSWCL